ncbi:hypothetical protein HYPSUDRAFT_206350 [Hypholoma sublateritium FD-334 SS-4]|uniref:Uncharacterized protein n=1 Tax=Hypholoma sublateritium (strain FD-334 SS-4) TaxID=945553 RepID=A0A0D2PAF2_HYPSF|nr:hypothetical protein HYPSUDRAFT_206350 [Hypholoma sublateritium FD-334 SS-4]
MRDLRLCRSVLRLCLGSPSITSFLALDRALDRALPARMGPTSYQRGAAICAHPADLDWHCFPARCVSWTQRTHRATLLTHAMYPAQRCSAACIPPIHASAPAATARVLSLLNDQGLLPIYRMHPVWVLRVRGTGYRGASARRPSAHLRMPRSATFCVAFRAKRTGGLFTSHPPPTSIFVFWAVRCLACDLPDYGAVLPIAHIAHIETASPQASAGKHQAYLLQIALSSISRPEFPKPQAPIDHPSRHSAVRPLRSAPWTNAHCPEPPHVASSPICINFAAIAVDQRSDSSFNPSPDAHSDAHPPSADHTSLARSVLQAATIASPHIHIRRHAPSHARQSACVNVPANVLAYSDLPRGSGTRALYRALLGALIAGGFHSRVAHHTIHSASPFTLYGLHRSGPAGPAYATLHRIRVRRAHPHGTERMRSVPVFLSLRRSSRARCLHTPPLSWNRRSSLADLLDVRRTCMGPAAHSTGVQILHLVHALLLRSIQHPPRIMRRMRADGHPHINGAARTPLFRDGMACTRSRYTTLYGSPARRDLKTKRAPHARRSALPMRTPFLAPHFFCSDILPVRAPPPARYVSRRAQVRMGYLDKQAGLRCMCLSAILASSAAIVRNEHPRLRFVRSASVQAKTFALLALPVG